MYNYDEKFLFNKFDERLKSANLFPLTEKEIKVIELKREGKTLEEIGKMYDVTRERIRQILSKSYAKLLFDLKKALENTELNIKYAEGANITINRYKFLVSADVDYRNENGVTIIFKCKSRKLEEEKLKLWSTLFFDGIKKQIDTHEYRLAALFNEYKIDLQVRRA
jgi:DNA-binding CsgD family transcriptional regulator